MEKAEVERAKCDAQYVGSLDGDPERATQDVSPSVRRFVFRRDGGKCSVPGCRSTTHLEVHHIEPRARGGKHDPENLILLCDGCHTALHRGHLQISGTAGSLVVKRRHSFEMRSADRAHVGVPAAPEAEVRSAANSHAIPEHEVRSESASDSQPATRHDVHVGASDSHTTSQHEVQTDSHVTSQHEVRSDEIRAHVGARSRFEQVAIRTQALDALVRLDFKRHEARAAVDAAAEHFEQTRTTATLESFLRIALSKCPRPRRG